jgi:hypothetical protein
MMELKGRFNSKMIKKAKFGEVYFDELGAFASVEKDRVTGAVSTPSLFVLRNELIISRTSYERFISRSLHEISEHGFSLPRKSETKRLSSFYPSLIFWINVSCLIPDGGSRRKRRLCILSFEDDVTSTERGVIHTHAMW